MTFRRSIAHPRLYDSELTGPTLVNSSVLRLTLILYLHQVQPARGAATAHRRFGAGSRAYEITYGRWDPAEWLQFVRQVEEVTERIWNGQLFLLPPDPLPAELRPEFIHPTGRGQPFVACALNVDVTEAARTRYHALIHCYRVVGGTLRSHIVHRVDENEERVQRSTGDFDQTDVTARDNPEAGIHEHVAVAHEIGHLLGLDHPNEDDPECRRGDEDICYGPPGSPERLELMGGGNQIVDAYARPWLRRLRRHIGNNDGWTGTTTAPAIPDAGGLTERPITFPRR